MILYKIVKFAGKQIAIDSTVHLPYPTVSFYGSGNVSVKANFGDD
jgi:hypothetical protein